MIRAHIAWFLWEVMTHQDDPRFAGKAIPIRNLAIVGGMSMLFPLVQLIGKRWKRYPWGWDSLYLSVYWLDMAGNSFDLYDRYTHFDLIPHLHGTGAFALVFERAFGLKPKTAFLAANGFHGALEAQEILTDVFFKTHNVRGWWDSAGDITVGILGTLAYPALARRLRR
ncbi:MAG: hypothetical protein HYY42_06550 [Chloroflexi bacterium]|nr:hypothetical protein [Chloroflexota bacterium]